MWQNFSLKFSLTFCDNFPLARIIKIKCTQKILSNVSQWLFFYSKTVKDFSATNALIARLQNMVLIFQPNWNWIASSEFGTYSLCEQRRFRRACASVQSRQNLRCSLIQAVSQEEPSDKKPDPWPLWMAGHAQLKFVMTECSKTQIRLSRLN